MVRLLKRQRYFMGRIKRLYEFQCAKGEKWYKEEQEIICPIKKDCEEEIKVIGYSLMEIIHATDFIEKGGAEQEKIWI